MTILAIKNLRWTQITSHVKRQIYDLRFGLFLVTMVLLGCTPGLFFGDGKDESLSKSASYQKIHTSCSQLTLTSPELSVSDFRNLLKCLNANHALDPIENLFKSLSDPELKPLVELSNQHLLGNKKALFEIETSYRLLDQKGLVDPLLFELSRLFENDELIPSFLAFLGNMNASSKQEFLKSLEIISKTLTVENIKSAIQLGLILAKAPAFLEMQEQFRSDSRIGISLHFAVNKIVEYLKGDSHTFKCGQKNLSLFPQILKGFRKNKHQPGYLVEIIENILSLKSEDIPPLTEALRHLFHGKENSIFNRLVGSTKLLHTKIDCMNKAQSISSGAYFLMSELANLKNQNKSAREYILVENRLKLAFIAPFCELPEKLNEHYQPLVDLAEANVIDPMVQLLSQVYVVEREGSWCDGGDQTSHHPGIWLLIDLMSNSALESGKGVSAAYGIDYLSPIFSEMAERDIFPDILLIASSLNQSERQKIYDFLETVAEPRVELGGKAIAEVAVNSFSNLSTIQLIKMALSLKRIIDEDEPLIEPVLTQLWNAISINNVHPLLDLFQSATANSTQNAEFLDSLLIMAGKSEFKSALQLISDLSKNGTLKELIDSVLILYHRFAQEGSGNVVIQEEVVIPPEINHVHKLTYKKIKVSRRDRESQEVSLPPNYGSCNELDLNFFRNTSDPSFNRKLQVFLECLGNKNLSEGLLALNKIEQRNGDEENAGASQPFVSFQINLFKKIFGGERIFGFEAIEHFINRTILSNLSGINKALDVTPQWLGKTGTDEAVIEPLIRTTKTLLDQEDLRSDINHLAKYGASQLRNEQLPDTLSDLGIILGTHPVAPMERGIAVEKLFINQRVDESLEYFSKDEKEEFRERFYELIEEAKKNVNNWESVYGKPRQSWDLKDSELDEQRGQTLKAIINSAFKMIGESEVKSRSGEAKKTIIRAFVNFLRYFTVPESVDLRIATPDILLKYRYEDGLVPLYHPKDFLLWLYRFSTDYKAIRYIYPGENKPRIRFVNTLDLLEILLTNVDYPHPIPGDPVNLGLKFLTEVGTAWGDEPAWVVPSRIQEEALHSKRGLIPLKEVVRNIAIQRKGAPLEDIKTLAMVLEIPEPEISQEQMAFYQKPTNERSKGVKLDKQDQGLNTDVLNSKNLMSSFCDPREWWGKVSNLALSTSAFCVRNMVTSFLGRNFIKTFITEEDHKVRLFNILEARSALIENAPEPVFDEKGFQHLPELNGRRSGGLQVLRDFFFELYDATPKAFAKTSSKSADQNYLSMVLKIVKAGALRQIGKQLLYYDNQEDPESYEVLNDMMTAMIEASKSPHMEKVLQQLVVDDSKQELFWKVLEKIFSLIDQSELKEDTAEKKDAAEKLRKMKKVGIYFLAAQHNLSSSSAETSENAINQRSLIDLICERTSELLSKHYSFFKDNVDFFIDSLSSDLVLQLSQSAYVNTKILAQDKDYPEAIQKKKGLAYRLQSQMRSLLTDSTQEGAPAPVMSLANLFVKFYNNDHATREWKEFVRRFEVFKNSSSELKTQVIDPFIQFFQKKPLDNSSDQNQKEHNLDTQLARSIRMAAAELLNSDDFGVYLDLMQTNSDDFYKVLSALAESNQQVKEFLDMIRRGLSVK